MDTEKLLKLLKENKVRFVVIGATAFPVHGYSRATLDIDIFIEPNEDNARRTLEALRKFGYDVSDISVDDLLTNKVLIRQYLVETDIHPFVKGVGFERIWSNKVKAKFGDEGSGHDWWHIYRVWQTAKTIATKEKANLFIVELAALLHDIADWKFANGDEKAGGCR